jgi:drug/metabolite transporter (DMT)-like permease
MRNRVSGADLAAIVVCTLAWGTTWYAITWQLGTVDALVSVVYRFAIASLVLFAWCRARGEPMGLAAAQHRAALGIGLYTFAIDYALVYLAEERVTSAVVAVMFATLAFANLIAFRVVFRQRAPRSAWVATGLGALGVGLLSWGELAQARMNPRAAAGLALAALGVVAAAIGNVYARRAEEAGVSVAASTAWGMGYGAALLAFFVVVTGREWGFDARWPYVVSLAHLALIGSVVAFVLYYGLARRRGYATASYVSALTPPLAMLISALFEGKHWSGSAFGGIALVVLGQWLLLRARRA